VFYKWALEEVGGFDPIFTAAGDDVDLCWRLQRRGHQIGFSPAGFVWHYRRSTVAAYLQQQKGYGEAEAMLVHKHPEYFNLLGGSIWRGRIYAQSNPAVHWRRPIIYHGLFGTAQFQTLYAAPTAGALMFCTSLEYHVLVALPLWVLSVPFHFVLPLAVASLLVSLTTCAVAGGQAELPAAKRKFWSRPLVALLFFLQPVVRGAARYRSRLELRPLLEDVGSRMAEISPPEWNRPLEHVYYWSEQGVPRMAFLQRILRGLETQGWPCKSDTGWSDHDVEIFGSRWSRLQLTTVAEACAGGRRIFRCRLKAAWSLLARVAFWSIGGLELLVVGIVSPLTSWVWLLPLTLPILGFFIDYQKRNLEWLVATFLDAQAKDLKMTKLDYDEEQDRFTPRS
jgi:O-antigen biosynthesis protein